MDVNIGIDTLKALTIRKTEILYNDDLYTFLLRNMGRYISIELLTSSSKIDYDITKKLHKFFISNDQECIKVTFRELKYQDIKQYKNNIGSIIVFLTIVDFDETPIEAENTRLKAELCIDRNSLLNYYLVKKDGTIANIYIDIHNNPESEYRGVYLSYPVSIDLPIGLVEKIVKGDISFIEVGGLQISNVMVDRVKKILYTAF